jgi:phosphatidylserine/phosphatidylglycerophosphate/cardiolipin synthase-like enzyme
VTSNLFRFNYSDHVDLQYLYDYILNTIVSDYHVESKIAEQELKQHLHLAYISYNHIINTNARSHNKFWIVDDKVFYFGSHNFYPTSLQQFGIIVDSIEAGKILLESYVGIFC